MGGYESLSRSKWECKYHVVFIPKCRRKTLYVELRRHLGDERALTAEVRTDRSGCAAGLATAHQQSRGWDRSRGARGGFLTSAQLKTKE